MDNEITLWCYSCKKHIDLKDANKCNGCIASASDSVPPSKWEECLNKEEKKMIVTIIGSLTKKKEMDEIKDFWTKIGATVNSPTDFELEGLPLIAIQNTWIKKIEEADLIVAVPKYIIIPNEPVSKYVLEFGDSTSYEMAIANRFHKTVVFA